MSIKVEFTGYFDKNGIPIAVGDLVRMKHFVARQRRKQIYLYKKVMIVNGRLHLVDVQELGLKPTAECHKCFIKDAGDSIEVLDGDSVDHPLDGVMVCWWERKRLPDSFLQPTHLGVKLDKFRGAMQWESSTKNADRFVEF